VTGITQRSLHAAREQKLKQKSDDNKVCLCWKQSVELADFESSAKKTGELFHDTKRVLCFLLTSHGVSCRWSGRKLPHLINGLI